MKTLHSNCRCDVSAPLNHGRLCTAVHNCVRRQRPLFGMCVRHCCLTSDGCCGLYWPVAALNLTTSSAGTRPRSFTSMPCALAHSRTSVVSSPLADPRRRPRWLRRLQSDPPGRPRLAPPGRSPPGLKWPRFKKSTRRKTSSEAGASSTRHGHAQRRGGSNSRRPYGATWKRPNHRGRAGRTGRAAGDLEESRAEEERHAGIVRRAEFPVDGQAQDVAVETAAAVQVAGPQQDRAAQNVHATIPASR
jgi:hypothetical protein